MEIIDKPTSNLHKDEKKAQCLQPSHFFALSIVFTSNHNNRAGRCQYTMQGMWTLHG